MISPAGNLGISLLLDDPVVQNLQAKKIYRSIYLHIYIYVCVCVCACVLSRFSSVQPFVTLWTVAYWVPLSLGFSGQEYWSGLSCTSPEDLPDPEIKPVSPTSPALSGRFFTTELPGKATECKHDHKSQKKKKKKAKK